MIQTIGRAARNVEGTVIMYADTVTESMQKAINETNRRRKIQMEYNKRHGIIPRSVQKGVRDVIEATKTAEDGEKYTVQNANVILSADEIQKLIARLTREMKAAAADLQFEKAAEIRDRIKELKLKLE